MISQHKKLFETCSVHMPYTSLGKIATCKNRVFLICKSKKSKHLVSL